MSRTLTWSLEKEFSVLTESGVRGFFCWWVSKTWGSQRVLAALPRCLLFWQSCPAVLPCAVFPELGRLNTSSFKHVQESVHLQK